MTLQSTYFPTPASNKITVKVVARRLLTGLPRRPTTSTPSIISLQLIPANHTCKDVFSSPSPINRLTCEQRFPSISTIQVFGRRVSEDLYSPQHVLELQSVILALRVPRICILRMHCTVICQRCGDLQRTSHVVQYCSQLQAASVASLHPEILGCDAEASVPVQLWIKYLHCRRCSAHDSLRLRS